MSKQLSSDQRALFVAGARHLAIPDPEARVDEAVEELADMVMHLEAVMAYPLPMQLEPATLLEPADALPRAEGEDAR